jgi:quercetin dioxygenase-like cupin family protein
MDIISTFQIAGPMNSERRNAMSIREKRITAMTNKSVRILAPSLAVGLISSLALWLAGSTVKAQQPDVVTLMSKALAEFPGKEVLMITVEFPPGGYDPVHKHDAHGFIYVLEGSVVMQVKGGQEVTLAPGQTFYEGPDDVHVVGRNASNTKSAKMLVILVKNKGAPILVPVK